MSDFDFDYGHFSLTVLANEIEEEIVRVKRLEAAISELPEARDRLANLKAEMAKRVSPEQPKDTSNEDGLPRDPIAPMADLSPGKIINPVVDHEDNEFTGERTYIYADGTRSAPCPAPASSSPNGQAQE